MNIVDIFNARATYPPRSINQSDRIRFLEIANSLENQADYKLLEDPQLALRYYRIVLSIRHRYYPKSEKTIKESYAQIKLAEERCILMRDIKKEIDHPFLVKTEIPDPNKSCGIS